MNRLLPLDYVIDELLTYIVKRQLQGRPTTVRQCVKRVGLGRFIVEDMLAKNRVEFVLIPVGENRTYLTQTSTEVAIVNVPDDLAKRFGFDAKEIRESYHKIFGETLSQPMVKVVAEVKRDKEDDPASASVSDPYRPYRITTEEYQALREDLIDLQELLEEAEKRGYAKSAIKRAVGGEKMRYRLAGEMWRPYVYRKKRFYLRDVIRYLHQSFRTYKNVETGKRKWQKRRKRMGLPDKPMRSYTEKRIAQLLSEEKEAAILTKSSAEEV